MDSEFTYLTNSAAGNDLRWILDEKQIINLQCCQEKKKKTELFQGCIKTQESVPLYQWDFRQIFFCLVFITSDHKKYMEIKESLKKSKYTKRFCKCDILESCSENCAYFI